MSKQQRKQIIDYIFNNPNVPRENPPGVRRVDAHP